MMKYTKTYVHNHPKNILGWASLDLNDLEMFFLNFPTYPKILKNVDPKQSHLRASRFKIFWGTRPPPFGHFAPSAESPLASYFSKIAPYSYQY
jgi:hypothetical protein